MNLSVKLRAVVFVALLGMLFSVSVMATKCDGVTVYIYKIDKPVDWKGKTFTMHGGTYWVGEIHIQYGGSPPSGTHTRAYCIEYDVILYTSQTYHYTKVAVEDNAAWRSAAYVLSWHDPPQTDTEGASIQGAIWQILTGYNPSPYGSTLATEAGGMDVVREGDAFAWLTPVGYVAPGEDITLTARLTNSDGHGRPNVRVEFETTGGTLSAQEGFTDSNGEASVTLTAPNSKGLVEVTAHTRGVWPELYLCTSATQDLIGIGDLLLLTTTTDLYIIAEIHVIPEVPYGALTVVATCFLAYMFRAGKKTSP